MGDWKLVKGPGGGCGPEGAARAGQHRGRRALQSGPGHRREEQPGREGDRAKSRNWPPPGTPGTRNWLSPPGARPAAQRKSAGTARRRVASNASTTARGKPVTCLSREDAPQVANRPLMVSAQIEPRRTQRRHRRARRRRPWLRALPAGRQTRLRRPHRAAIDHGDGARTAWVRAVSPSKRSLAAEGRITLSVNGRQVAEGRAPGLIAAQPARGSDRGQRRRPGWRLRRAESVHRQNRKRHAALPVTDSTTLRDTFPSPHQMGIALLAFAQRTIHASRNHISPNRKPRKAVPSTLSTLGDQIQFGRFQKGLFQSQVAELLGVTTADVRLWEQNERNPTEPHWIRLANLLSLAAAS